MDLDIKGHSSLDTVARGQGARPLHNPHLQACKPAFVELLPKYSGMGSEELSTYCGCQLQAAASAMAGTTPATSEKAAAVPAGKNLPCCKEYVLWH